MSNTATTGDNATLVQVYGDNNYVSIGARRILNLYQFTPNKTQSPSGQLSPYNRGSRFVGRESELRALEAWLGSDAPVSVRVLVGQAGLGKTRLAIEAAARAAGWTTGFLTSGELRRFVQSESLGRWEWSNPTFAIVDYAEQKAQALSLWMSDLSDRIAAPESLRDPKLRILLLERHAAPNAGWFSDVFGSIDTFNDRKIALCDPKTPIVLEPLDASSAHEILEDSKARFFSENSTSSVTVFQKLNASSAHDQLVGNPLMLQIAAAEDAFAEDRLLSSRNSLLEAVVSRERTHMVREWRNEKIKEFLIPHLLQLTALICLNGGASLSQIAGIIDECTAFRLLGQAMNISDILAALKPILRGDGDAIIRPIEPDLIGDLFLARSDLAAATVAFVIKFDPYAVARHLWRILDDFGEEEEIIRHLSPWIEHFASTENNSIAIDMFIKGCKSGSKWPTRLMVLLTNRVTEKLKTGGKTVEILFLGEQGRESTIALSLVREARALCGISSYELALAKIDEAKVLYGKVDPLRDIEQTLSRIELEAECCRGLGHTDRLAASLKEGIDLCEHFVTSGAVCPYRDGQMFKLMKEIFGKWPRSEGTLTPRGLEAILPGIPYPDLRLTQGNMVLQMIYAVGYPRDLVVISVSRSKNVLEGDEFKFYENEAKYWDTKYRACIENGQPEYAKEFSVARDRCQRVSNAIRPAALELIVGLQRFVIAASPSKEIGRSCFLDALGSIEYAIANNIQIRESHLTGLVWCFISNMVIDNNKTQGPAGFVREFLAIQKRGDTQGRIQWLLSTIRELIEKEQLCEWRDLGEKLTKSFQV